MPDLSKLKGAKTKAKVIDPEEIFRRLPAGINDLYQSQAEVLRGWFGRREERDLVIKLHTGGGKTLVGLLMAQSAMKNLDRQTRGWFEQMAARFAHAWGNEDLARELQTSAYANNRVLHRPVVALPYQPIRAPAEQSRSIAENLASYRMRRGFLQDFEEIVALLVPSASANQFEQALADFGRMIGFSTQRPESTGEPGSDVLWLLPGRVGVIIEAKSRKKNKNALSKENHGQLLVSQMWFTAAYPTYTAVRVSVHPSAIATKASVPIGVKALTYDKLQEMIGDARTFFATVCESNVPPAELASVVDRALKRSSIGADRILLAYLQDFTADPPGNGDDHGPP
jgi:hypothetical protein